jgi:hypothetical protein
VNDAGFPDVTRGFTFLKTNTTKILNVCVNDLANVLISTSHYGMRATETGQTLYKTMNIKKLIIYLLVKRFE